MIAHALKLSLGCSLKLATF